MKFGRPTLKTILTFASVIVVAAGGITLTADLLNGGRLIPKDILGLNHLWEKNIEDLRAEYDQSGDELDTKKESRNDSSESTELSKEDFDISDEAVPLADLPDIPRERELAKDKNNVNNNNQGTGVQENPSQQSQDDSGDGDNTGDPQAEEPAKPESKAPKSDRQRQEDQTPEETVVISENPYIRDNIPASKLIFEGDACVAGDKFQLHVWLENTENCEESVSLQVYDTSDSQKLVYEGSGDCYYGVSLVPGKKYNFIYKIHVGDEIISSRNEFTYVKADSVENNTALDINLKLNKIEKTVITVGKGAKAESNIMDILCQKNGDGKRIIKGQILRITPETFSGTRLYSSNIKVIIDGVEINTPTGNGPYEYQLWGTRPQAGDKVKHKVEVVIDDGNGNITEEIYEFVEDYVGEDIEIGTATVRIDFTTVSANVKDGNDIEDRVEETEITILSEEPLSYQVAEALHEMGYSYEYAGSLDDGFYLESINDRGTFRTLRIPNILWKCLLTDGIPVNMDELTSKAEPIRKIAGSVARPSLGEFDFTRWSGWMYCVNGYYPGRGMSDYYLKDGDVVELRFTLCMGKDIGGYMGAGYDQGRLKKYCGTWINGKESVNHIYNEHGVCQCCGTAGPDHECVMKDGRCLYCDNHEHIWEILTDYEWAGYREYVCSICGATKSEPKEDHSGEPEYIMAKSIEAQIEALGIADSYVLNEEEVKAIQTAREAYDAADDLTKRYVGSTALDKLTRLEDQYKKLEEAVHYANELEEAAAAITEIALSNATEDEIKAVYASAAAIADELSRVSQAVKRNLNSEIFGTWDATELAGTVFWDFYDQCEELYLPIRYSEIAAEIEARIDEIAEISEYSSDIKAVLDGIRRDFRNELDNGNLAAVENIEKLYAAYADLAEHAIDGLDEFSELNIDTFDDEKEYECFCTAINNVSTILTNVPEAKSIMSEESIGKYEDAVMRRTEIEDTLAAEDVELIIRNIPSEIDETSAWRINDARSKYDRLNENAQTIVSNYQRLLDAEDAYARYIAFNQAYEVEQEIDWIMTVTLESEEQIKMIREKYDALSEYAKAEVRNYDVLLAAEASLKELKNQSEESEEPEQEIIPEEIMEKTEE